MIDDYLHNFESRRQQGYQDLQRAMANDIAGYGGDQRRIMGRQLQYGLDLSDFNAEMDQAFDPYGQGKWQAEQARAAYSPESLAPPQAVIDNYAPMRAEMQSEAERRRWANESNLANAAMYRTPDPEPQFDSRGELTNQAGVIDFDAARRSALSRASTQFRQPSTSSDAYSYYGSQNFPVSQPTPRNFITGIGYVDQEQPVFRPARTAPMRSQMSNPNVLYSSYGQNMGTPDELVRQSRRRSTPDYFDGY